MESVCNERRLLFIEPQAPPSPQPVVDDVTRKMCAAFRQARLSDYAYGGVHQCVCRATSSCCDHFLPDGTVTNSLCIHYLAHHRPSVPPEELKIVATFTWGEAEPNENELQGPQMMAVSIRRMVERSLGHAGQAALQTLCAWGLDVEAFSELLRSVNPGEREETEALFALLQFFSCRISALSDALEHLKLDAGTWGRESLRLPIWNRSAWLPPMLELLQTRYDAPRERTYLAFHFRYLCSPGVPVPQALIQLKESAEGELRGAVLLAIRGLSGD